MSHQPTVGILCLDTTFDKIPGHIRNPQTFDFPISLKVVRGATPERLILRSDPALLQPFIDAARELEEEGVAAIVGSCGFLMLFQREIARALRVPFLSSSVLMLPQVWQLFPDHRPVGVMTARAASFGPRNLQAVGAGHVPVAVIGMEDQPEFVETILEGRRDRVDVGRMRAETVRQACKLQADTPEISAILLECTDLPPFSTDIQRATGLPVFDIVGLTRMLYSSLTQKPYTA